MASQPHPSNWQDLVAAKRHECEQKIPRDWLLSAEQLAFAQETPRVLDIDLPRRSGLLSEVELDLTENYTASQLLNKLASGQVNSLAVTTAFCKRAAIAQQVVSTMYSRENQKRNDLKYVLCSSHVSQRPSSLRRWSVLGTWMNISSGRESLLVPYTAYRLV